MNDRPHDDRPRMLEDASPQDWLGANPDPDVLLSVPDLGVDRITLKVEDLQADVDLRARILNVVELHVGAHASLGRVELEIDNVHAQAMLKVKLDKVAQIADRVMRTLENNPELLTSLTAPAGRGVEELAKRAGEGVREIGASGRQEEPSPVETRHEVEYDEPERDDRRRRDREDRDREDREDRDWEERDRDDRDREDRDWEERDREDRDRDDRDRDDRDRDDQDRGWVDRDEDDEERSVRRERTRDR